MHASGDISAEELKAAREKVLLGDDQPAPAVRERVIAVDRRKRGGCGPALVGLLLIIGVLAVIGANNKPSSTAAAKSDPAKVAAEAEDRRKGFHCLSAWDGSNRDLVRAVKDRLREPGSFEHVETRIAPVDAKGQHTVVMTYRGRNGFGGMNVENAVGTITNAGCTLLSFVTE